MGDRQDCKTNNNSNDTFEPKGLTVVEIVISILTVVAILIIFVMVVSVFTVTLDEALAVTMSVFVAALSCYIIGYYFCKAMYRISNQKNNKK